MSELTALAAVGATAFDGTGATMAAFETAVTRPVRDVAPVDFSTLLSDGLATMDAKVVHADNMVARFALDDSVPVHQVTIALEEARLSVEFAMQVRQRFVEGYKELMNIQL